DSTGATAWGCVVRTSFLQSGSLVVPDGQGGAVVSWAETRGGLQAGYAQRFNVGGVRLWTSDGAQVTPGQAGVYPSWCAMVPDGTGGLLASWEDWFSATQETDLKTQGLTAIGRIDGSSLVSVASATAGRQFGLTPAYPNPARGSTGVVLTLE